jgi:hypothetical protein
MTHLVDFNLHNLFSIRLENPLPEAVRAVKNQIGVLPSSFPGEPDLTVCYVDHFETPMYHLVMGSAGFANDEFYVVGSTGRKMFRAQIPFEALGQPCKVICETGTTEIPLLHLILNLRMLAKGLMPFHASAFVFDGIGVVVNGWPKGGKTSTLFSFLAHGAQFISDDWLFVDSESRIYGLMQPIKLSDWQLNQLPDYQPRVSRTKQWTIQGIRWLDTMMHTVPESLQTDFLPTKAFYKGLKRLNNSQRHVSLSPEQLFGTDLVAPTGDFDVLLLTLSQETSEVVITPMATELAIERLLATFQYEWMQWEKYYVQYLYAFPHRHNLLIESSQRKQRELLEQILANKPIFAVSHPHPVALDKLYQAINPVLKQAKRD